MRADYREVGVDDLLTIDEALAQVLARVAAARRRRGSGRGRGRARARAGRARGRRPAAVRQLGDGRLRGSRGRHARRRSRSSAESPPAARSDARCGAGEAIGDLDRRRRPGRRRRRRAGRGTSSVTATSIGSRRCRAGAHVRPRGGDVAQRRGRRRCRASCSGRPRSVRSPPSGSRRSSCARRPRVAVLATDRAARAGRAARARRDLRVEHAHARGAARGGRRRGRACSPRSPTTTGRTREALARGLEATCCHLGRRLGRAARPRAPRAAELGVEEVFWRVAVKPGKPIAFAIRGTTLVFGLPGNPVSSLVGFELFVRPALLALQGATPTAAGVPAGRAPRSTCRGTTRATSSCGRASRVDRRASCSSR